MEQPVTKTSLSQLRTPGTSQEVGGQGTSPPIHPGMGGAREGPSGRPEYVSRIGKSTLKLLDSGMTTPITNHDDHSIASQEG